MKSLIIAMLALAATPALAVNVEYNCKAADAVDVGLPQSIYVEIEETSVHIQNDSNDLYYSGELTNTSEGKNQVAIGFKGLILDQNGRVLISDAMLNGHQTATLEIVDAALDSVETKYSCQNLN